ncbi:MAG: type II secretion system F family protein [Alphaproteobacteria bacterium]|nr:type II secretion system F family protein [Alphaproteobacteria bacterium]
MVDPILVAALFTTVLLGGALVRVLRSERRRANLEPLLSTIAMAASSADVQVFSLRRSGLQRNPLPTLLSSRLELTFASTGNRIGLAHIVAVGIAAAATVGLVSVAASVHPILAIALAGAAAAGAPALLLRFAQSRYQRKFLAIFPDALDLIVRAVRSGLPAPEAIELVTHDVRPPVSTEFRQILDELRIGTELEEALQRAADRIRVPDFRFFAVSLLLQRQTGGGIAETISNLGGIIRQRKALRMKARALTAEAQASAAIIASTPFVAGVGLFLIDRALITVLFFGPRGRFMLGIAVASLLTGSAAMRALIKKNLR